jgi:purine-binding chemotaxis protein CheW
MTNQTNDQISSYITFELGEETFASHVNNVVKILEMQKITEVPKAPDFMKGVINLRGSVLPVIDTRIKFGFDPKPYTEKTCILVLSIQIEDEPAEVGAIVDAVCDVLEYPAGEILPPPNLGSRYKTDFVDGVMKLNNRFIMILNMNSVFSTYEIINLKTKAQAVEDQTEGKNQLKED